MTSMTVWHVGSFRVLFRWRGSLWRAIWKELVIFYILYYALNLPYRFALTNAQQKRWNTVVVEFNSYLQMIPITFLLGFYVSSMVSRYFNQFFTLAWPDDLYSWFNMIIPDDDETSRQKRRTMVRYLVLACALSWRDISTRVRKRFPRIDHLVSAGLMTIAEREIYETNNITSVHWMIPIDWCQRFIEELLYVEQSLAPPMASHVLNQLNAYKAKFRLLHSYNWLSVPLAYTQVATGATYSYFLFCLIGRQFLDPRHKVPGCEIDFYVPIFTTLQFIFYVGWLKVGQKIMCPFGESADDFELNALLDRHLRTGLAIVDGQQRKRPDMTEDMFHYTGNATLPHTMASIKILEKLPRVKTGRKLRDDEITLVYPEGSRANRSHRSSILHGMTTKLQKDALNRKVDADSRTENGSSAMRAVVLSLEKTLSQRYGMDDDQESNRSLPI